MSVKLIKIRNILGVSDVEFEPGKITEISGRNAAGKTSILNAIRSVLKVSSDATLLRQGEESGEVVLVLDDGTEVGRRFTQARSYPFARKDDMNAPSPVSFINSLTGEYALNPVEFIMAGDKQRVEYLLGCVDIELDPAKFQEIAGIDITGCEDEPALNLIDSVRRDLYDKRTGVNRAAKEAKAAFEQLQQSIPDNPRGRDELAAERNEAVKSINTIMEAAKSDIAENEELTQQKIDTIDDQIRELQEKKAALHTLSVKAVQAIKDKANTETQPMRDRVIRIDASIEEAARVENTLQIAAKQRDKAKELEKEGKELTKRIARLDEYRVELLQALPLGDLNIVDGRLYHGEIPFDQVNSAEQVRIAFELARMSAGKLGLICVDGLELLDAEHYDELLERAKNSDVQLILTAVSNDELKISA